MQKILLTVNEDRSITRTDNLDGSVLSETLNDLFIEFTLPSFITANMTKTAIIGEGVKPPFTIILDETNIVPVPEEVLKYTSFYVSIYGYDIDNKVRVTCKSIEINIGTSGYSDGDTPPDPTPTIYEQLLASLEKHPTVDEVNVLISNYMDEHPIDAPTRQEMYDYVAQAISAIDIPTKVSDLENDSGYLIESDIPSWSMQPEKPTYTASEIGAEEEGNVSAHNTSTSAHADIREDIQDNADAIIQTNSRIDNLNNISILNKGDVSSTLANVQTTCTTYIGTEYSREPKNLDGLILTITDKGDDYILYVYSVYSSTWIDTGSANIEIANADSTTAGIAKLYNTSGNQIDGGITPKAVDDNYKTYSWAKQENKPTYTADEVGSYTTQEVDTKLIENAENSTVYTDNSVSTHNTDDIAHQSLFSAVNGRIDLTESQIADIEAYIGYDSDDILGLEVDFENSVFTRIAGAVGKTAGADFDSFNMFGGRKRCNLSDSGIVNAYYGDATYIEDGTNGQVMVEQPKFYYKVVPLKLDPIENGIGYHLIKARYYVSDTPKEGFKLHPAFIKAGIEKDKIYYSAYEGCLYDTSASTHILDDAQVADFSTDKLCSISNSKPISGLTQDLTRRNCGILAENRGVGWSQSYMIAESANQLLFIIEYGMFNSQIALGSGNVNNAGGTGNESKLTGLTSSLGNTSGSGEGTDGLTSITYRGVENSWGNIWKYVDGCNIYGYSSNIPYIKDSSFVENSKEGYTSTGFTLCKANGYVSGIGYSKNTDYLFLPSRCTGDSSIPVGDYFNQNNPYNGFLVALLGGSWNGGSGAGLFCWSCNYSSGSRGRNIGGRIFYS